MKKNSKEQKYLVECIIRYEENLVIKGRNKDKNENCYLVYGVEITKAIIQIVDLKIDSVNRKVF